MDANYNLTGLINRVKMRLNDEEYSSDEITQYINDAYFDILGESEYQFLEKHYLAHTQKSDMLLLPPDFQTVALFTATTSGGRWALKYMPYHNFFEAEKDSGVNNYHFTIFGNNLFYSLPDISPDGQADNEEFYDLDLFYLAKPRLLSSGTDKPIIPAEFGEILVLCALARAERRRDNFDYAQIYENKADELITNMKLRYSPRQLEGENRARLPLKQTLRH